MRVAFSSVHSWPAVRRGGERYVHELAAALMRAGHDVRVLSTGPTPRHDRVLDVPVTRLPVRRVPRHYPQPWGDVAVEQAFGLQALLHLAAPSLLRRVDVWHATSTGDAAAASLVAMSPTTCRTVFTDHGFPARRSRQLRPDRRQHRLVVRHIDDYVCVSHAAAAFLTRDYGRAAIVVPPGVQLSAHSTAARRHPRPALLYSGSLVESRKNVGLLLEAVAILREEIRDVEVWLLGPGDASAVLAAAPAAAREAVTRVESVDDETLRMAYADAWVTVLPSQAESFGMTVVESLASGTPAVVLTDSGGPAEIIDDDAIGRRCDSTPHALAQACGQALELAARPVTAATCRDRARDFDWDGAIVPRMLEVYAGAAR